jgi:molybdenum cofactor cytidylyltransferase
VNAAVILAAGESLRMGFPKQLGEYKGSTILETTIKTVSTYFEDTVVILGHDNETIIDKVDFKSSVILINENWQEGIISSIRTGLHHLNQNKNFENVFIFLGDQPSVDGKVIQKLLDTKHDFDEVMIPQYRYKYGYPVVVPKYFWNKLELITQDNSSDEIDSVFGEFDLINFFESSEFKTKSINFNFLRPTDFDQQKDF